MKKRVLIAGAQSFIGDSIAAYLCQWPDAYNADTVDMRNAEWKTADFSIYDAVFYVAGIAHRKETAENAHEYFEVNRDLAVSAANKAKNEGVGQFIFLSTGTVYGMETGVITPSTPLNPKTAYGQSKAEAEQLIIQMKSDSFKVAVLRPLMVYGKNCRGNFQTIIKLVKKLPVFPLVHNKRSLIYIDNLAAFVKMTIDRELSGVFFPKNKEDADIFDIVNEIAKGLNKRVYMSRLLGACVYAFRGLFGTTRKAFTDLVYQNTEEFDSCYCVCDTRESFYKSV